MDLFNVVLSSKKRRRGDKDKSKKKFKVKEEEEAAIQAQFPVTRFAAQGKEMSNGHE